MWLFGLLVARADFPVLLIRFPGETDPLISVPPGTGLCGGGRRLVGRDVRGSSDGCSVRLAVLLCRVFGRDVVKVNVPGGGGSRSFGFRLRPPTTSSRLLRWFARCLSCCLPTSQAFRLAVWVWPREFPCAFPDDCLSLLSQPTCCSAG